MEDGDKCIELKSSWGKGYQRKANALHAMGKKEEALEVYQQGFDIDPTNQVLIKELS